MSIASISYGSLKDASNEAKDVAKKLGKYADSLYDNVYKKLSKYDGDWTSNLSTASSKTNSKISELRSEQSKYEAYATDLIDLRDECKEVDKAVKSNVSSLTASFKEAHGIRNSKIENAINYFFTGLGNKTAFGRWLGGVKDDFDTGMNYFKDSIKAWYNYDGGKELVKGVLVGLLEVTLGVIAIVGAILTGGALLVVIAGVVGGIIAVANGIANIANEGAAYTTTRGGDPATGRRRSKINTLQDYLRSSFIFGSDGENYEYNEFYNGLATGIDVVNIACTVVTVVSSVGKLLKDGYKWATGSSAKSIKQVFSKEAFSAFGTKVKSFGSQIKVQIADGFSDIKTAFKYRDMAFFKDLGGNIRKKFGQNILKEFWDFSAPKESISSIKNMLKIPKELLKDDLNVSNVAKVGFSEILLPGLTSAITFHIRGNDQIEIGEGGQLQFDLYNDVTVNDITDVFEKIGKNIKSIGTIMTPKQEEMMDDKIVKKLSEQCNLNISIPKIYVPSVEMPVLRTA